MTYGSDNPFLSAAINPLAETRLTLMPTRADAVSFLKCASSAAAASRSAVLLASSSTQRKRSRMCPSGDMGTSICHGPLPPSARVRGVLGDPGSSDAVDSLSAFDGAIEMARPAL